MFAENPIQIDYDGPNSDVLEWNQEKLNTFAKKSSLRTKIRVVHSLEAFKHDQEITKNNVIYERGQFETNGGLFTGRTKRVRILITPPNAVININPEIPEEDDFNPDFNFEQTLSSSLKFALKYVLHKEKKVLFKTSADNFDQLLLSGFVFPLGTLFAFSIGFQNANTMELENFLKSTTHFSAGIALGWLEKRSLKESASLIKNTWKKPQHPYFRNFNEFYDPMKHAQDLIRGTLYLNGNASSFVQMRDKLSTNFDN